MSLGEIVVLLIVGIIVVGPKNLPSLMRTAGQWVSKLRRMSTDLRSQSGIDDLIRHEGLEREIAELRSLARMNVVDSLITPALGAMPAMGARDRAPYNPLPVAPEVTRALEFHPVAPLREREYPVAGCDAYGALDDDAGVPLIDPEPERVPTEAPTEIVESPAPTAAVESPAGTAIVESPAGDVAVAASAVEPTSPVTTSAPHVESAPLAPPAPDQESAAT